MKNLKIGKKLLVTFGIIIVMFMITVVVSLFSLLSAGQSFEDFYQVGYPVSLKTSEMRTATQTGLKALSQAMLTDDVKNTQELVDEARTQFAQVDEGFEYLKQNFQGDQTILTETQAILGNSKQTRDQILDLADQNKNDEATKLMFDTFQPMMVEFRGKMIEIDSLSSELADENYQSSRSAEYMTLYLLIGISVVALFATIILAVYITKGLTKPITEIETAANQMAAGTLDVSIGYTSKDELGSLSESMRTLTGTVRGIIQDMGHGLTALGNGDFTVDSERKELYVGDFQQLSTAMYAIIGRLSDTLAQINQAADQVSNGSDQVASGAQALSQGSTEQASSVEELAATVNEISEQVNQNAQSADEVNTRAGEVGNEIVGSNQKMQEMIAAMAEISSSSNEIGKIIKTIEDIAFQTNILALNAAVEAARAGAAGKGFAVVADEVRNLASKSAEASANTSVLIESSIHAVDNGTKIADETATALLTAVEGAEEIVNRVKAISEASKHQAESISQVTQGIDQISSVVQTNSATSEESAAASEELSGQAQMLKELIGKFKLKETSLSQNPGPVPSEAQQEVFSSFGGKY